MASTNQSHCEERMFRTSAGTRTVHTNVQDGIYSSRLYVNCSATDLGDATLVARKHTSRKGAQAWANRVLAS
jgi:hypothetical protein